MLKNFDQFTINEQTIIPTIGRNPNDFEWQVLRHFYYSCYLNKPIPGINDIIDHGHNYLTVNDAMQLAVGLESKGSITSSSALRPCAALGTKPALKYQSKQSKISIGVVQNEVNQLSKISGNEELFFRETGSSENKCFFEAGRSDHFCIHETGRSANECFRATIWKWEFRVPF